MHVDRSLERWKKEAAAGQGGIRRGTERRCPGAGRLIRRAVFLLAGLCLAAAPAAAQDAGGAAADDEDAVHDELRAMAKGLIDAVVAGDVEKQLSYATEDVVVTWQNGDVVRGHQGLKDFMSRNQGIGARVFRGYAKRPEPAAKTILYGDDTGISYGTSVAKYNVLGKEFELENHWSATLVKQDDGWKIASYHVSGNILDNPLMGAVKSLGYLIGGVAFVVGLALGWLVFRKRAAAPPSGQGPGEAERSASSTK
ncbi:MAG: YybH family protein [Deltaproteobacteria bacterium]